MSFLPDWNNRFTAIERKGSGDGSGEYSCASAEALRLIAAGLRAAKRTKEELRALSKSDLRKARIARTNNSAAEMAGGAISDWQRRERLASNGQMITQEYSPGPFPSDPD
jgi:hypothetical protein